jgi:hypothetical protein
MAGTRLKAPRFRAGGAEIVLFLSYAEGDSQVAAEIAQRLSDRGYRDVSLGQADQPRPTIDGSEERISQATAYVALLSPEFLASPLCRRDRELALCREQGLRLGYPEAKFFHVLLVGDTHEPTEGLPPRHEWLDLTNRQNMERVLDQLINRHGSMMRALGAGAESPGRGSVFFRNRSDELELVVRGLTNFSGQHFWLVIAPPQLGKTWFLDRLGAMLLLGEIEPWVVRLVDVRDQKAEARTDVGSLLRCLFGPDSPTTPEPATYFHIARKIIASRQRHVCLIDSAELLAEDTARTLRACLSEIHHIVADAGLAQARLAVVVASRREDEWRGVTPVPRLSILKLTEFSVDVVRDALTALKDEMDRDFEATTFRLHARRVHRLSEGLPALLVRCIAWIRHEEWAGMERLETPGLFHELAQPYIKNGLLARESLFPSTRGLMEPPNAGLPALEQALRVLSPHRLFTQSHLRHYQNLDPGLAASMAEFEWTVEDLWRMISNSALLSRPLDEPWQEIPAAIRRLLYRHYYASDSEPAAVHRQVAAHTEAGSFMETWADQQHGKEQVIGLVECLWHQAVVLRLERSSAPETDLMRSAHRLSLGLRESAAYTQSELRSFADELIWRDDEFLDVVGDHSLVRRIVTAIVTPRSE